MMAITESGVPAQIDCETAARALYDYLDGRLPTPTMHVVHEHIDTCRKCAGHFTFARRVLELVPSALPLSEGAHTLRARIVQSLKAEGFSGI
jgi:anti-sigma factor RsiW